MDDSALVAFVQQKIPGITELHNGQGDVMRRLLDGTSSLAIIPTGGGKSLLWLLYISIAATKHPGFKPLCIVLVPYKSLILNHIEATKPWFPEADIVTSEDDDAHISANIDRASVVYMTPEKYVRNAKFRNMITNQRGRTQLVVYDEVHLLQEQSKFRPDLLECVQSMATEFQSLRLALTATSEVAHVDKLLGLACMPTNTSITRCSCDRSNCHIEIVPMLDTKAKNKETKFDIDSRNMFQRFNQLDRPQTIIFVISKREAVNLCNALQSLCDPTTHVQAQDIAFFHADLDKGERADRMKGFGTKALTVIVATTAFGTGVNYPNIRIIMHYTIPPTLVELLQNIGRGGRDGQPYQCIMYYSYKGILECGGVWAQGAGFDSEYWARYIEVVKYILSTKCRKAYIVPFFDTAFEPGTACLKCDNCRLAEVSMTIDIGRVAVIILQVVKEFSTPSAGILFSTLRDIVTCGGLSAKRRSDGALKHPLRGIGARQGYTAANRHVWSLACSYLLYSDNPLLKEHVKLANSTYLQKTIARSLMLTPAGLSFLETKTEKYIIRYPVELQHMSPALVQEMFSPQKKSAIASEKVCSVGGCDNVNVHAKSLCYKHYQADLRARKRPHSAPAKTEKCSFVSSADSDSESSSESDDDAGTKVLHEGKFHPVEGTPRSSSCPSTPVQQPAASGKVLVRPIAVRKPEGVRLSPQGMPTTPKKSPSPCSTSDTSSDEDDVAIEYLPIDGQFYPGTVVQQYMANPQVMGMNGNIFHFAEHSPYASFNSYAKQQLKGSISASGRTKRYKCLGVFVCSHSNCPFFIRPRVCSMRQRSWIPPKCGNVGLHGDSAVAMVHMKCSCIFCYHVDYNTNSTSLTVEEAPHSHPLPPPNKLAPSTLDELSKSIIKDGSQQSALRFASQSQDNAAMHPGRVRYSMKKLFQDTFGSDLGIGGLGSLQPLTAGRNWVRFAQPSGTSAGAFQMVFCQLDEQQTLCTNIAQAYENTDATTTPYIYTDVTYAYSDSYAQTYLTDSQVTGRGVITAFCLMTRLTSEAYASSFHTLLTLNTDLWSIQDGHILLKFYVVVDFADSQRNGFISAVRKLHQSNCPAVTWTATMEDRCRQHIKGCEFHYLQSVKNTANNGNVVPYQNQTAFKTGCMSMLKAESMDAFRAATTAVLFAAPKCRSWLQWWMNPLHACLIFPSFRSHVLCQDLNTFLSLPTTTNICESQHRNYYRFLQVKNLPIVVAAFQCFKYCDHQLRDVQAVATGLRPLRQREKTAIAGKKTAAVTRADEWDSRTGRPPTKTSEHHVHGRHKACGGFAVASITQQDGRKSPNEIEIEQTLLRDQIRDCGLKSGSVVQVFNDQNSDEWLFLSHDVALGNMQSLLIVPAGT